MSYNPKLAERLKQQATRPDIPTYVADILIEAAVELENFRPVWIDPYEHRPHSGSVLILTWGNICVRANFSHSDGRAWLPLPDTPAELKMRKRNGD